MNVCSVFSRDIIRDQNYSYLCHAQKHKYNLWAQLRWGVTSQMLSRWCSRRPASCLKRGSISWFLGKFHLQFGIQIETILDKLLTSFLFHKSYLLHDSVVSNQYTLFWLLSPPNCNTIFCSQHTSYRRWYIQKKEKIQSLSTSYLVDLTPLDKSKKSLGHWFSLGMWRNQSTLHF